MFLTVAILMVLLTHLLPIGILMMALAAAALFALAGTRRRPESSAGRIRPDVEAAGEPLSAVEAAVETDVEAAQTPTVHSPATSTPDRKLVGADHS